MKVVKATFIGANGSCGYKTGQEYQLVFKTYLRTTSIYIHRLDDGEGVNVYDSIFKFFDNWANVSDIDAHKDTQREHMLALADAQFTGYVNGKQGYSLENLCTEMGLTLSEWTLLQTKYDLSYFNKDQRSIIYTFLKKKGE